MPIAVSSSRVSSMESSLAKPVVSTMSPVAATAVDWPSNHGSAPIARPTTSSTPTDHRSSPIALPTAHARMTPSTAPPTWTAPWENVR